MKLILFSLVLFSVILVSAVDFGYNNMGVPQLEPEINYSLVNVNNSQYLQGYTPFNLPYLTSYSETDPIWSAVAGNYYLNSNPFGFYNVTTLDLSPYAKYQFLNNNFNGSGGFTTTGTITGEQITSTDDITMAGLFTNTPGVSDTTGLIINQANYTGTSKLFLTDFTGVVNSEIGRASCRERV